MNNDQNDKIFDLYKPLRNQLRQYELIDSLYVMWSFATNLSSNSRISSTIELPSGFNQFGDNSKKRYYGMPEHEIDFLVRCIILHCEDVRSSYTLKHKKNLSKVVNYFRKEFCEKIDQEFLQEENVLFSLNRLIHSQIHWQINPGIDSLMRYYKIYNTPIIQEAILTNYELSLFEIFFIGLSIYQVTSKQFFSSLPFASDIATISEDKITTFINLYSLPLSDCRTRIFSSLQMNENILYSYNPLTAKPIIKIKNEFCCPIPILLFWQITRGTYYLIRDKPNVDNALGESFQNYIGRVIESANKTNKYSYLTEQIYLHGHDEKRTSDWLLYDDKSITFIECKSKRMTLAAQTANELTVELEKELRKMANFVVQIYKTFLDYKAGEYPIQYEAEKVFIPLVVTMESWHVYLNPQVTQIIHNYVVELLQSYAIPITIIDEYPYYIRSCEEFEGDIQVIDSIGLSEFYIRLKTDSNFSSFLNTFSYQSLFLDEIQKTFIDPIKS